MHLSLLSTSALHSKATIPQKSELHKTAVVASAPVMWQHLAHIAQEVAFHSPHPTTPELGVRREAVNPMI